MNLRLPGFLTRNFKLKLACTLMATITWVGVVYAGNPPETRSVSVHVPQSASVIPAKYVLVNPVSDITVRIGGSRNSLDAFNPSALSANVAWKTVTHPGVVQVPLSISNTDSNIELIDPPTSITVDVDTLDSATVPVTILITNPPPQGYVVASESSSPDSVVVTGPHHVLAGLQARISVDLGNRKTNLVEDGTVLIYDSRGNQVSDVSVTVPGRQSPQVTVTITVSDVQTSRASAVVPRTNGSVAAGHELVAIRANPATVLLDGPQDLLNALDSVPTASIALNTITGTVTLTVAVTPPAGVSATPSTVSVTITVIALPTPTPSPTPTSSPTTSP